jgi:hypothetical protein
LAKLEESIGSPPDNQEVSVCMCVEVTLGMPINSLVILEPAPLERRNVEVNLIVRQQRSEVDDRLFRAPKVFVLVGVRSPGDVTSGQDIDAGFSTFDLLVSFSMGEEQTSVLLVSGKVDSPDGRNRIEGAELFHQFMSVVTADMLPTFSSGLGIRLEGEIEASRFNDELVIPLDVRDCQEDMVRSEQARVGDDVTRRRDVFENLVRREKDGRVAE